MKKAVLFVSAKSGEDHEGQYWDQESSAVHLSQPSVVSQKFLLTIPQRFFLPYQGGVGRLGLKALATCANADRRKKRAARRARWHEHPGGVRFTRKGLQARATKSSLARPFMARSYC